MAGAAATAGPAPGQNEWGGSCYDTGATVPDRISRTLLIGLKKLPQYVPVAVAWQRQLCLCLVVLPSLVSTAGCATALNLATRGRAGAATLYDVEGSEQVLDVSEHSMVCNCSSGPTVR